MEVLDHLPDYRELLEVLLAEDAQTGSQPTATAWRRWSPLRRNDPAELRLPTDPRRPTRTLVESSGETSPGPATDRDRSRPPRASQRPQLHGAGSAQPRRRNCAAGLTKIVAADAVRVPLGLGGHAIWPARDRRCPLSGPAPVRLRARDSRRCQFFTRTNDLHPGRASVNLQSGGVCMSREKDQA